MSAQPQRLELSWSHGAYHVSIPTYLSEGERVKLREDRAVAADIEAMATILRAHYESEYDAEHLPADAFYDDARELLAAVFSEVEDG